MKTKFKSLIQLFLVAVLCVNALPFTVFAEGVSSTSPIDFCSRLEAFVEKTNDGILEQLKNVKTFRSKKLAELSVKELKENNALLAERSEQDSRNVSLVEKIEAKATTSIQKEALATFKTELKEITDLRRQQVETAVANYRLGYRRVLENYNANTINIIKAFEESIASSTAKAKADCARGVSSGTVRQDFKTALQESSKDVRDSQKVLDKTTVRMETLLSDQKAALKKADEKYKKDIKTATANLKAVFQ